VRDVIVNKLGPVMAAEVAGVDLSRPLDEDLFGKIREAFHRHLLLVFPKQHIDGAQQIAFSRRFGELQVHVLDQYRHPRYPEIYVLSNVDKSGKTTGTHPDKGTLVWHSDLSFQRRPALATILSRLKAIHDLDASRQRAGEPPMTAKQRAEAPPVEHPVVRTHPETGRKLLYISRHVSHFAGMPQAQSDSLLETLLEHCTKPQFVPR